MKKLKLLLILVVLFISASAVSAEGNFTTLENAIGDSTDSIEITQDYKYDNSTDESIIGGIAIDNNDFTLNGNGHTIDGSNQQRIFNIRGDNVTLKNLFIINGNGSNGGGILSDKMVTFINITFIANQAEDGGAIHCYGANIINCTFINNTAKNGVVYTEDGDLNITDSLFSNTTNLTYGIIYATSEGDLNIENCEFKYSQAKYATAIYTSRKTQINGSLFLNLTSELTGGAIVFKGKENAYINNSIFLNTKAGKNGGAIFADFDEKGMEMKNVTIINSSADFGGAICQLGGYLSIDESGLQSNTAMYDGGAIYTSYTAFELINSGVNGNNLLSGNNSHGSGIYIDKASWININNNIIANNTGEGIYTYDSKVNLTNIIFKSNGEAVHGVFSNFTIKNVTLENNTMNLNDTYHIYLMAEDGAQIKLINNTIEVKNLPVRFDSRDWGWVTPVKNQGHMGACWTFGIIAALESSLLKATGIEYDFSENNMQNTMIQYSKFGTIGYVEGGVPAEGAQYLISWLGPIPEESDVYDEIGKISPIIGADNRIHIQNVLFIPNRDNFTDNTKIKEAVMKYGAVTINYYASSDDSYFNEDTGAYYQDTKNRTNHQVTIVGWDDNYSAKNFEMTPPGDGAFITKNSWGTESGKDGYYYISYYDTSVLTQDNYGIAFIIENDTDYNKNYQTDISGDLLKVDYSTGYKNTYTSSGNDFISAVGTYFDENENYTLEIYVNDRLMHTQNGTSPFFGFHTVKLSKEILVKTGDKFTAVMKKASAYLMEDSRQHYERNISFIEMDGEWQDLYDENVTASLKVYAKNLTIYTEDLVKVYRNESQFRAVIDNANDTVTFEINGAKYTRISDENGTARMNINLRPGNYTIKTTYGKDTVENNIGVLPTLIAENLVKYFRNESQFYISLIDGAGKAVPNVNITMNINGVFYNRTTNANGTARLNINLNPGEYILTAIDPLTGLEMSYNITVLPVLTAEDVNMTYMDGTQFAATLIDGTGKALVGANITFNINGIFYNRTTDEYGIAHLNIRLMPGEYIITSQYSQAITSNKITIAAKED